MATVKRPAEDDGNRGEVKEQKTGVPTRPVPSTSECYPSRDCYDELISIAVGQETSQQQTFQVHKGVLTFYSGYFQASLEGRFLEANDGVIRLPMEEVDSFKNLVHWLYSRQLPRPHSKNLEVFRANVHLYVLADRRVIPILMNDIIGKIRDLMCDHWIIPTVDLRFIYANTPEKSGLRRCPDVNPRKRRPVLLRRSRWQGVKLLLTFVENA